MKQKTRRWLFSVPGRKKWYIVLLTVLHAVYGGIGVWYALLLRGVVDHAAAGDAPGFWRYALYMALLVGLQLLLHAVMRRAEEAARSGIENVCKQRLADNILKKEYASIAAVHSGEWMNRLTNDTVIVANGFVDILPGIVGMVVRLVSALILVIVLDSRFAMILIPGGVVLLLLTYAFRKVMKRLHKNVQEADGRMRVFWQERIGNLPLIRSFSAEERTEADGAALQAEHRAARLKRNAFSIFCNIGFGTAMHGLYLFGVCYCCYGILKGSVTYGTLTAIMQLVSQIQGPFANLSGYLPRWYAMLASAERLMEIETYPDEQTEPPLSQTQVNDAYRASLQGFGLDHVSFTYRPPVQTDDAPSMPIVLRDLSLSVNKGETVAFTGQSGCGKSTVLKLLMGLYRPDAGACVLMQNDGTHIPLTPAWRRLFAYVPQGNGLMSGTVREVVAFGRPEAAGEDAKLWHALKIACADTFVKESESGLETRLGERGAGLSEGQLQRLAIARALFADCPVLLLDEATSALASETERRLLDNLRCMTDKTVIIVTHRPAALAICDRVLRFTEDGIRVDTNRIETAGI